MGLLAQFKQHARRLRTETYALYLAARHPHTPWAARLLVAAVVAYAASPIDLIPDFIPVLGYLDDLLLLPLGISLAIRLIPPPVLAQCRAEAAQRLETGLPASPIAAAVIVVLWLATLALMAGWAYKALPPI